MKKMISTACTIMVMGSMGFCAYALMSRSNKRKADRLINDIMDEANSLVCDNSKKMN